MSAKENLVFLGFMTRKLCTLCAVLGVILGQLTFTSHSSAQLIGVSNIDAPHDGNDSVVASSQSVAAQFTTGADVWLLDFVQLGAKDYFGASTANFEVSLYSASGNVPGTKLADFSGPNPAAFGNYTYTATAQILLQPGTTYFIVAASAESASFYAWGETLSTSFTGLPGWTLAPGLAATADGVWGWVPTVGPPLVSVNVSAVPEPSAFTLAALGLGALGVYRVFHRSVSLG